MATVLVTCEDEAHSVAYVEALVAVGIPADEIRVITPDSPPEIRSPESCRQLAAGAAGLLLCGGPDMEPHRFGEAPLPQANLYLLPTLDEMELAALDGARQGAVPVWGICRGLQVLNVFFGGTLFQDLELQRPGVAAHRLSFPRDALIHPVQVTRSDHPMARLLAGETPLVNSRHHQAVKELADDLEVVGIAPDGVIEAVVYRHPGWWVQAVQWHPENLLPLAQQRALWGQFVAQVEARSNGNAAGKPSPPA